MTSLYDVPPAKFAMKRMIYDQFVGGANIDELKHTTKDLKKQGIEPMIAIPMEPESLFISKMHPSAWRNENLRKMVQSFYYASILSGDGEVRENRPPVVHLKVTGLMDEGLFLKLSDFVGFDWRNQLATGQPNNFEKCVDELLKIMQTYDIDAKSATPGTTQIYDSLFYKEILDEGQMDDLHKAAQRITKLANDCARYDVECAIDAEYVNVNPAISILTLAMARHVNTDEKAFIWNTYQCYLKNTKNIVNYELAYLQQHNKAFGAKVVRGAYMEKERLRAEEGGYADPVNDTIEDTHENYNDIITSLILKSDTSPQSIKTLIASHNEDTVRLGYALRKDPARKRPENIIFGQLYGMCDHISSELGANDVPIYKSMPIGHFKDVMPYLARRGTENKSVMRGTHREALLLKQALWPS